MPPPPALSIIIPLLDEAAILPELLANLARQQRLQAEILLCDGGSGDDTVQLARRLLREAPLPGRVIETERGRARQMNAGAAAARGRHLLFLHADCSFPDPLALHLGLDSLDRRLAERGDRRAAGRFGLHFRRQENAPSLDYFFCEAKARLDRPGCIHGDQGFLLPADFFAEVGPFDPSLPLLEDDRLAERIRQKGEWVLLPAEIETSARRFETEGFSPRQTLNALAMNFAAIGWDDFFRAAPHIYRQQAQTGRLRLAPFFNLIRDLLRRLPWRQRLRLWLATGAYVRSNAWQLPFFLDARRAFLQGKNPAEVSMYTLRRCEPWLDRLTGHPPGRGTVAFLTWLWFHAACLTANREEAQR